jgi:hypothetical protein
MQKLGMALFAGALTIAALGCDDGAIDKSEQAIRCERIGNRVKDCAGSEYDDTGFRKACVDESDNDTFQAKAESCDECLDDDKSCTQNLADCAAECTEVIATTEANN